MARVRAKIEKNIRFGRVLVRIRPEIENNTFLVGLWLGLGQKKSKTAYFGRDLVKIKANYR